MKRSILVLICTSLLSGCGQRLLTKDDAILRAISFEADKKTVKSVFSALSTKTVESGRKLIDDTLGTNNLSSFLLTHKTCNPEQYALFINPQTTVPIVRCATAGGSLVKLSDVHNIELHENQNGWHGTFTFNVMNSFTGLCEFVLLETHTGCLITRLSIPPVKSSEDIPDLVIFEIEETYHLLPAKRRPYFQEVTR